MTEHLAYGDFSYFPGGVVKDGKELGRIASGPSMQRAFS